ncbi:hypothetical protein NP233_g10017 [Leucocoprinus birnbaumii]|uniref:Uncharacterized protein n=1 Tax=Leucocoprinus birnbaumii TaxID=56174 RepID=A0AAD5YSA5_9AGAR|nr:hypothetical protein NP233_g10017 [Leucocoprinus birnbaumii]
MSPNNQESGPAPAAPPPPYTEFAAGPSSSSPFLTDGQSNPSYTSTSAPLHSYHQPPPMPSSSQPPPGMVIPVQHHPGYGPTPLASNQPLLPYAYYEARGSADARARSRFIGAVMCAFLFWLLIGFVVIVEVVGVRDDQWIWGALAKKIWALEGMVSYWVWLRASNGATELAAA